MRKTATGMHAFSAYNSDCGGQASFAIPTPKLDSPKAKNTSQHGTNMRTTTVLALAAATAATTTLAKNAGGFQLLYTSSANVSWCVQPRAEDDNGNAREPQVGDQLIFDDCHYAVEGLKRGQIWRWSGNQLQSGTNSSLCIGLGERVVLAFCGKDEDDQGEDGDGQGEDDGDNEAAGAMAPKITVAASLIDYQGLGLPPPGSATKDAAEAHGTVGASSDAVKKTDVKTKWLFPQDGKLCVSEYLAAYPR